MNTGLLKKTLVTTVASAALFACSASAAQAYNALPGPGGGGAAYKVDPSGGAAAANQTDPAGGGAQAQAQQASSVSQAINRRLAPKKRR